MGISRSTVYYIRKTPVIDSLEKLVLEIFDKHNANYGCPRIKVEMNRSGYIISKRRIGKILKRNDRESKHGRKKLARNIYTAPEERYIAENLIKTYKAKESNEICQMDATQFTCKDGKLFACGIIDVYDKTVVVKTGPGERKELICETIEARLKLGTPLVIHSDRGSANASKVVKDLLAEQDILQSMSAPHRPNENQYIETFWKTLKTEIGETKNWTRAELKIVLEYQMMYYNMERIHTTIGNIPPMEKRLLWLAKEDIRVA